MCIYSVGLGGSGADGGGGYLSFVWDAQLRGPNPLYAPFDSVGDAVA